MVYRGSMDYAANLSFYASNDARARYREKIRVIGGLDPFEGCPGEEFLQVEASVLVAYLVLQTNFLTVEQCKASKSLEAYNWLFKAFWT